MGNKKRRPHVGGCTCRRCEPNGRGQPQVLGDDGGGAYRKAGRFTEAVVTGFGVASGLTAPPPPNPGQLADAQSGQHAKQDEVNNIPKARESNSNTGSDRPPKGK